MDALKQYYFGAKHAPNSGNKCSGDREADNRFTNLVKDAKPVADFSPSRQFFVGRNNVTWTRPGCRVQFKMEAFDVASFEMNFFRIAAL